VENWAAEVIRSTVPQPLLLELSDAVGALAQVTIPVEYRPALSLVCIVVLLALSGVAHAQSEAPKGDPAKGRATFAKVGCYQCHGREAQGSPATGPRLGPNPLPYPAFAAWVRRPKGEMPPYTSRVLSDEELADIYAFVVSRPGK
jgi:mono/diheme cytochrome c family protein